MTDYFYLSWFCKDEAFHKDMWNFAEFGSVSSSLEKLYSQNKRKIEEGKRLCVQNKISTLVFSDSDYPECFKNLERPPWVLTYKGNLQLLEAKHSLSVVGSRRADPEALYWLNKSAKKLKKSTVLISGGAIGVDQEVHKTALREGLSTVVVLPVGLVNVYPLSLAPIIGQFIQRTPGKILVLSQFYPNQSVYKSSFYPRNYILSSISNKLIVVQSEVRSGSMVTAKYALENNKDIYTLPASPWDLRYSGNLKLLEEGAYQLMDFIFIQK